MISRHFGVGLFSGSLQRMLSAWRHGMELLGAPALASGLGQPIGPVQVQGTPAWRQIRDWGRSTLGLAKSRHRRPKALYLEALEQRQLMSVFHLTGSPDTTNPGLFYHLTFSTNSSSLTSWTVQWGDGSPAQTVPGNTPALTHSFAPLTHPIITATATDSEGLHTRALVPAEALPNPLTPGRAYFIFETAADGTVQLGWTTMSNSSFTSLVTAWTQTQAPALAAATGDGRMFVQATVSASGTAELQLTPFTPLPSAQTDLSSLSSSTNTVSSSELSSELSAELDETPASLGHLTQEVWDIMDGDPTNPTQYLGDPPGSTYDLTSLESSNIDVSNDSITRIQGYLIAPETGDYTFWLAADKPAQLYLSTGMDAAALTPIAAVSADAPTGYEEFLDANSSYPQCGTIHLEQGQLYRFVTLQEKFASYGGSGNLAVAWADNVHGATGTLTQQVIGQNDLLDSPALLTFGGSEVSWVPAPTDFAVTTDSPTQATLSWYESFMYAGPYLLRRFGSAGLEMETTVSMDQGWGQITYTDTSLNPDTACWYTVQAFGPLGQTISDIALATAFPPLTVGSQDANAEIPTRTPTLSGTTVAINGAFGTLTLELYAGSAVSGTPVTTWTTSCYSDGTFITDVPAATLTAGTYTVRAMQSLGGCFAACSPLLTFTVNPAPAVSNLAITSRGTTSVTYTLTFDAPVAGVDASDFALTTTGTINGAAITAVTPVAPAGGLATTWTIDVAPGTGWGTLRLDLLDDDTIHDAANRPLGGAGADNGTFFGFDATLEAAFSFAGTTATAEDASDGVTLTFNTDYYTPPADTLWTIDWGDGHTESQTTSIPTFNHNYTSGDGSYSVCALATGTDGSTLYTSDFIPVTVAPSAPDGFTVDVTYDDTCSLPLAYLRWTESSNLVEGFDLYYRWDRYEMPDAACSVAGIYSATNTLPLRTGADAIDPEADGFTRFASCLSSDIRTYTMFDLPRAGTYTFLLVAVNAGGRTITSAEASHLAGESGHLDPAGYGESHCARIGFQINFYGARWDYINVNENGTVSFGHPFQPYPTDNGEGEEGNTLPTVPSQVIAPFWSGISTESINDVPGGVITYGPETGVVDPQDGQVHQTFAVHWTGVDHSLRGSHVPQANTFSLYLFNRSDRGLGDFDIAFVYGDMQWDTVDTGICAARAGFTNGTRKTDTFYELAGSGGGLLNKINSLPNRTFSYAISNMHLDFTAYRTSGKSGEAVSETDVASRDPNRFVLLANDDYDADPECFLNDVQYNAALTNPNREGGPTAININDPDLAKITLAKLPSSWTTGTIGLRLVDGDGNTVYTARLYDSEGNRLDSTALSNYLLGLHSHDLDIYVEALTPASDVVLRETYHEYGIIYDQREIHFRIVSMATQAWSHLLKSGASSNGIYASTMDGHAIFVPDSAQFSLDIAGLTPIMGASIEIGRAGSALSTVRPHYSNGTAEVDVFYSYDNVNLMPDNQGTYRFATLNPDYDDMLDEVITTPWDQLKRTVQGSSKAFYYYAYVYNGFAPPETTEAEQTLIPCAATAAAAEPNGYATPDQGLEAAMFVNFKALYGDYGQSLLQAYYNARRDDGHGNLSDPYHHFIQIVHRYCFQGKSRLFSVNNGSADGRDLGIRIHDGLTPAEAAKELYSRLIEAAGMQRGMLRVLYDMAVSSVTDYPCLEGYDGGGLRSVDQAWDHYQQTLGAVTTEIAKQVEFLATNYYSVIALIGEGANIVVCMNGLLNGNPADIIGLIPVVGKAVSKTNANLAFKFLGKKIGNVLGTVRCRVFGTGCFLPGTPVQTQNGLVPIEEVSQGDLVWSYDRNTGEWLLQPVDNAYRMAYDGLVYSVKVGNDTLTATETHPFFVLSGANLDDRPPATDLPLDEQTPTGEGRWVDARYLQVGDTVLLRSGVPAPVDAIDVGSTTGWVYNLTVDGFHDFAVGNAGVLVHNGVVCTEAQQAALQQLWKDGFQVTQDGSGVFYINGRRAYWGSKAFKAGGFVKVTLESGAVVTVKFKPGGFPDFTPFLYKGGGGKSIAKIVFSGDRYVDEIAANKDAGFLVTPKGFTWHHSEVLGQMELVDTEIHSLISHTGGFAIFKAAVAQFGRMINIVDSSL
jgi:hypothetical protein